MAYVVLVANKSYNVTVPRPRDNRSPDQDSNLGRSSKQQRKMEGTGILIIALLILAVTLARYWHQISWSLR